MSPEEFANALRTLVKEARASIDAQALDSLAEIQYQAALDMAQVAQRMAEATDMMQTRAIAARQMGRR